MALTGKSLIVLLSITVCGSVAPGAEKERPKFTPGPASSYESRQTISNVTIAAAPYESPTKTAAAFGKMDPNRYGLLPILIIIENGTGQTISLENMQVELVASDRRRVEATPAADVKYLSGPERPKVYTGPIPGGVPHLSKKKNPLASWEIEGRAFTARMLPPKESANGFVYFRAPYQRGSSVYITGLREASTGKELFYFEIPLDKAN